MGMFTNDILFGGKRLDEEFRIGQIGEQGEPFILLDAIVHPDPVPTSIGDARKSILTVCKFDTSSYLPVGEPFEVGTLAQAIAAKVEAKEDGDLPAVVHCHVVPAKEEKFSDATVMSFIAAYDGPTPTKTTVKAAKK